MLNDSMVIINIEQQTQTKLLETKQQQNDFINQLQLKETELIQYQSIKTSLV